MGLRRRLVAVCACVAALAGPVAAARAWPPLDGGFASETWLQAIDWPRDDAGPPSAEMAYPDIAFLDSGVLGSGDFSDLIGPDSADCLSGRPRSANAPNVVRDISADHHGTFVATLAAAPADGGVQSYVGVAPFAPVVFVRVSRGGADLSGVGCGLVYLHTIAKDEPVVVNMSFDAPKIAATRYTRLIRDQALLVAATPNQEKPTYAGRPAQYQHTLAVGDSENRLHPSQSTQLDVLAPGSFDDLATADIGVAGSGTASPQGTSFATAVVSGAAALVWAHTGTNNPQVVAYLLRRTAKAGTRWTKQHGFGTIDVDHAVNFPVPVDDEYEPNDTFRSAWSSPTTPVACPRRCTLHGIAGKTDDPQELVADPRPLVREHRVEDHERQRARPRLPHPAPRPRQRRRRGRQEEAGAGRAGERERALRASDHGPVNSGGVAWRPRPYHQLISAPSSSTFPIR